MKTLPVNQHKVLMGLAAKASLAKKFKMTFTHTQLAEDLKMPYGTVYSTLVNLAAKGYVDEAKKNLTEKGVKYFKSF